MSHKHLNLEDLGQTPLTPEQKAHLDTCVSCRLEARLFHYMQTVDDGTLTDLDVARPHLDHTRSILSHSHLGLPLKDAEHVEDTAPEELPCLGALGEGGMAQVWRLADTQLGRTIAVKWLKASQLHHKQAKERFIQEAKLTAQLQHPGIVPIHRMGELQDGRPYFTMQEVHGQTLATLIQTFHGQKSPPQPILTPASAAAEAPQKPTLQSLLTILWRAALTVAYAHDRGIIHRDIKPANIMVGAYYEVFMLDWGLAKALDAPEDNARFSAASPKAHTQETQVGSLLGTLGYMAPEQARGQHQILDKRADVYALGATLYEICTGDPFRGPNTYAHALEMAQRGDWPELEGYPHFPPGLQMIFKKASAKGPEDRYTDAKALAHALQAYLEGETRRQEALEILREADGLHEKLRQDKRALDSARQRQAQLRRAVTPESALTQRRPLWHLEDQIEDLALRVVDLESTYLQKLQTALNHHADLQEAHDRLADHYLHQHQTFEKQGDMLSAKAAEAGLRRHGAQRHEAYLKGVGYLDLTAFPAQCDAILWRLIEVDRRLRPKVKLGPWLTGAGKIEVPMGSYTLVLIAPDGRRITAPITIQRLKSAPKTVPEAPTLWLPRANDYGRSDVFIPGGYFEYGSRGGGQNTWPTGRIYVPDFFMEQYPVTNQNYLRFLNDLVDRGQADQALDYAPQERPPMPGARGTLLYARDGDGHFMLKADADGDLWQKDWPVMGVNWFGARAYCEWIAYRSGWAWRLPHELEWEKAARGTDGRRYPWGNHFEAPFAIMNQNPPGRKVPASIHENQHDRSPYDVMGMAGNTGDWCLNAYDPHGHGPQALDLRWPEPEDDRPRSKRGGAWIHDATLMRVDERHGLNPHYRSTFLGFRLVRSPLNPRRA